VQEQPVLSEAEWLLVLELLERESFDLPGEIHHTDKRAYRAELRNRMDLVTDVMARIRRQLPDSVPAEDRFSQS
jgi:hypothetical protein